MVWSHEHSPHFSYARDARPRGYFSYAPAFWSQGPARAARAEEHGRKEGFAEANKQMLIVGGAILGTIAVGAIVVMAAKKRPAF